MLCERCSGIAVASLSAKTEYIHPKRGKETLHAGYDHSSATELIASAKTCRGCNLLVETLRDWERNNDQVLDDTLLNSVVNLEAEAYNEERMVTGIRVGVEGSSFVSYLNVFVPQGM
jgi:hypothetical protein